MPSGAVRMPNGVRNFTEHGLDAAEVAEAEAQPAAGDPRGYERAREWLGRPRPARQHRGTPILTRLFEALREN